MARNGDNILDNKKLRKYTAQIVGACREDANREMAKNYTTIATKKDTKARIIH